jgi:hypothetical protein
MPLFVYLRVYLLLLFSGEKEKTEKRIAVMNNYFILISTETGFMAKKKKSEIKC